MSPRPVLADVAAPLQPLALAVLLAVGGAVAQDDPEAQGRALMEQARTAAEQGDVQNAALGYFNAGQVFFNARLFAPARQCFERLQPLADELGHPVILAAGHVYLGSVLSRDGELDAAIALLEQGLAESEQLGHAQLRLLGASRLGDAYRALGRLDDARAWYLVAQELMLAAGDDRNRIANLSQLARLDAARGDIAAARAGHEAALALAEQVEEPGATTSALLAAGQFEQSCAHFFEAERLYERALDAAPLPELKAAALGQLGNIEVTRGRYGDALASYDACLALAREIGDLRVEATALGNLGSLLIQLGERTDGAAALAQALALLPEDFEPAFRAELLVELGNAGRRDTDPAPARASYERALELARSVGSGEVEFKARQGLFMLAYDAGDFARALDLGTSMQELAQDVGAEHDASLASNLADLHLRLGDAETAQARATEAMAAARVTGDWRAELYPLLVHVEASLELGDLPTAESSLVRAEEHLRAEALLGLPTETLAQLRSVKALAECGEFAQDLAARRVAAARDPATRDAAARAGFARADLWKGQALLAGIAEHRSGGRSADVAPLRRDLRDVENALQGARQQLAVAVRDDAVGDEASRLRDEVDDLAARRAGLQAELAERAPREAVLDVPRAPTPEQLVDAVLRRRGRLVEFVEGKHGLGAYVISPDGIERHALGDRAEIGELVDAFVAGLADRAALSDVADVAAQGRALYELLLRPVLGVDGAPLAEDGPLVLVPCPLLAGLSFDALVVESSVAKPTRFDQLTFVLERHLVVYGPSSSVLALLAATPPRAGDGSALVLADPTYISEVELPAHVAAQRTTVDLGRLPRLFGTRTEARAIARDLGIEALDDEVRSGAFVDERLDLRIGADASPSALSGDLRRHRILHFATHALLDAEDARRSGLVLSPEGDDDGFVPLADLLELDLDADLTVLSACETARGELQRAEGVQSLARAFLHAGSRAVIASLWRVDDLATAELMAVFYRGLLTEGRPPAEALRRARLSLLRGDEALAEVDERGGGLGDRSRRGDPERTTAHPYAWAAFVYDGLAR